MDDEVKITELTLDATPVEADVLPIVVDTAGTPATRKTTVKDLLNAKTMYSIVPAGGFALTAGTSAQPALPAAGDTFTLEAGKTYEFEGCYYLTKSGTTTTVALLFALGGSLTSLKYFVEALNAALATPGTPQATWIDAATAVVINATSTGPVAIRFRGIIRTNAAGTLTPQLQFSAAPTTPVMAENSYFRLTAMEGSTDNVLGAVS